MKLLFENWRKFTEEIIEEAESIESVAKTLQDAYKFNQELKGLAAKAPDKADPREAALFKKIVDPAMELSDKASDEALKIGDNVDMGDRESIRQWRKSFRAAMATWRKAARGTMDAMIEFYNEAKRQGFTISKPWFKIVLDKSERNLKSARLAMKHASQDERHSAEMDRIKGNSRSAASMDPRELAKKMTEFRKASKWLSDKLSDGYQKAKDRNDRDSMNRFREHFENFMKINKDAREARENSPGEIVDKLDNAINLAKKWGYK